MVRNYVRKRTGPKWTKITLNEAVEGVKSGKYSGYEAAARFNIPRSTIMSHVNGLRGQKSESMGRPNAIPVEYEKRLANSLHVMEKNGFGLSRTEILDLVQTFIKENKIKTPFRNDRPGQEWFNNFCKRHNLSLKKPQSVEMSRKKAADPFIFEKYFDLLYTTIYDLGLESKPHRVWNIDETSFVSDPKKTKVVGLKGFASTRTTSTAGKDNTTVLFACNAAGEKGPPFIIYKGKNTWSEWTSEDAYPGTVYTATENGWIETKAFKEFISKSFIPMLGSTSEPTLLIYDGHSTHVQPSVLEVAKEHNITIIKLPPHSSHLLQPLDLAVFKPFKDRWDTIMVKWQRSNYGRKLTKKEFSYLIGQVWLKIDPLVIKNGFKKGGIYPLNRDAIPRDKFDPLALKRWEDMKMDSGSCHSTFTPNTTITHPFTLKTLSLNQIMACFNSACTPKANNMTTHSIEKKIKTVEKTFEELLLNSVKQNISLATTKKKTKIAGGAEVITHIDVINRLKKIEEGKKKPQKLKVSGLPKKDSDKVSNVKLIDTPSTSKKVNIIEDKIINHGQLILRDLNQEKNIKIHKNTLLHTRNKKQEENLDPKLKRKKSKKIVKAPEKVPKKPKNINYSSSDESNYSIQDSDMSDYNINDDLANKEIEDSDTEIGHALTDIEYYVGTQKYALNDWVLVQFCTKKSIKHFVGQIVLYNDKTPTIRYVRKVRSYKTESIFTYPINDDICELMHIEDILAVLPAPEISRRGQLIFKINFNNYNIQ